MAEATIGRGMKTIWSSIRGQPLLTKARGAVTLSDQQRRNVWKRVPATDSYFRLHQPDNRVQVSYVWIDGTGISMREKTMTVAAEPKSHEDCPMWSYDGSSTYQAEGGNSDMKLKPVRLFKDPFRGGKNKIVLCESLRADETPAKTNHRTSCVQAMEAIKDQNPWFGLEQEYTFMDLDGWPFQWPKPSGFPAKQGPFYCSVGAGKAVGRDILEAHYRACLYCDMDLGGNNMEVMPGQAEFQIGPTLGVDASDQLWMARFFLERVAEEYGVIVTLDPKPVDGEWNGAGCHCNFSTDAMRNPGGKEVILKAIEALRPRHKAHIEAYDPSGGVDNARRLVGRLETSSIEKFTAGVADRSASVRIPRLVEDQGCGFLEDRRPSSNCDPYRVTDILVRTICLGEK